MASFSRLFRHCGVVAVLLVGTPGDAVSVGSGLPHSKAALAEIGVQSAAPERNSAWQWPRPSQLRGKRLRSAAAETAIVALRAHEPGVVCLDSPRDWRSNTSNTCDEYRLHQWCTKSGGKGEGWSDNGEFKDWAPRGGVSAVEACCACGGGEQVQIVSGGVGSVGCAQGQPIVNEALCKKAAEGLGATFGMAAHWPIGHPGGCHADLEHKKVWLNSHPQGTPRGGLAPLCLMPASQKVFQAAKVEAAREEDREDDADDEDEEDDEDEDEDDEEEAESRRANTVDDKVAETRHTSSTGHEQDEHDEEDQKTKEEAFAAARTKAHLRKAVVEAHEELRRNMRERVAISSELQRLDTDEADSHGDIDRNTKAVAKETRSQAMAGLLGDMWREMRMFAQPFYEERLAERLATLETKEDHLKEAYENAKRALEDMERK